MSSLIFTFQFKCRIFKLLVLLKIVNIVELSTPASVSSITDASLDNLFSRKQFRVFVLNLCCVNFKFVNSCLTSDFMILLKKSVPSKCSLMYMICKVFNFANLPIPVPLNAAIFSPSKYKCSKLGNWQQTVEIPEAAMCGRSIRFNAFRFNGWIARDRSTENEDEI